MLLLQTNEDAANDFYPDPILPKKPEAVASFLDVHPIEMVRQLTLIESKLFGDIVPTELLAQAWNKKPENAPHVVSLINRFNKVRAIEKIKILNVKR